MTRFFKRQWPLFGLGVLLAVVASYLIKSEKAVTPEKLIEDIMPDEGLRLREIHFAQNNPENGATWVLDASEVRFSGDQKSVSFNVFRLKVTPKDRPDIELTGAKGDYSRDSGEINLWGNLKGASGDGYRIITEHLLYNEKKGQLTSDKPVKIFGPFFSVDGRGLFVDLEKETLEIRSNITAVVHKDPLT